MVECSKTVIDAIELGMAEEKKASDFYAAAAAKLESGPGKALFTQLSEFETGHYEALKALKASLEGDSCYITYESALLEPVKVEGGQVRLDGDIQKTILDILTIGIRNEKNAGQAYRDLATQIEDSNGIAMFENMAKEEAQHARILEDQFYEVKNRGELVWGD
ncbi:MAG: ferritin family protein [Deltaproteobacteria bacterium]|nr:ferritin family protein [Deltaproteobacteria bacterium]